ncbi:type VI secretion system protein ImpA [Methylobacterium brachiatum]|uniref:Type VI secretion system protein ImpA n=1 Tax=Methylobacterium brachiatum TaxID=269660 RepID=A0AAJ1WXF9_9HYPH|nr:type VI secretion system ImpA family N-terminal domain-containing protein [Methylobacterium brachiatum]MCB4805503.1 type VI secretion system ImpA family N-terminal domain-containing protein [Methylobacterium brachiatum]MDQ0546554.1 type VI secretion system protein ImpA [Methylobacterium brachiatum]
MALDINPDRFLDPITEALPCGDDLDEAGDPDFLNGVARAESRLPSFYLYREGGELKIFDRSHIDFARESELLLDLLDRTRDLRLFALLGRLAMLDRDLRGFGQVLAAVAGLLEARWDGVHPRGAGDDYDFRAAVLQALEDNPTVILPLQHTTLFRSRRYGPITFRNQMVATGEVPPAGQDPGPDRAAITRALEDAEPDTLAATRVDLATVADAIGRIGAATLSRGGGGGAVDLGRLKELIARMREFVGAPDGVPATPQAGAQEPALAVPASVHVPSVGAITSTSQAASALAAAALYLRTHEPSSLAEVLVRQAQTLVGKSFVEVMRILMPDQAPEVAIVLGAGRKLRLTFDQLAAVPDVGGVDQASDPTLDQSQNATEASDASAPKFRATTRGEAVALLRETGHYFRQSEPASPIPLLLEKAAALADRDFLAVLKDVLSDPGAD